MSYIDLHMHSNYSDDGEFTPKELADLCIERGVKYFAIADHNSVRGIEEGKEYIKDILAMPPIVPKVLLIVSSKLLLKSNLFINANTKRAP